MINREQVNQSQVSLLVQTAQALVSCLRAERASVFDQEQPQPPQLDGGSKSAIEMALIQVCNRIDSVMKEDARWTCKTQQQLEKHMLAVNKASVALMKAQTTRVEESNTPHGKYKPKMIKLPDYWVAFLGDLLDIENTICGIGRTPQEALEAFDGVFIGKIPEQTVQWYSELEQKRKYEQQQNMDFQGSNPAPETPFPGENQPGNSPGFGPDDESGPNQVGPPGTTGS